MKNLTSSMFFKCFFASALVQHLAANKTFEDLTQQVINEAYHFGNFLDTSDSCFDIRKGITRAAPQQNVMMKTTKQEEEEYKISQEIAIFKDLYFKSGEDNLLLFHIPNMFDHGVYGGKKAIILNLVGDDLMKLITYGTNNSPQYYGAVCQWATQLIAALRFLHQQGYVHGDVQPKNIAEGAEDIDSDRNDVSFKGRVYLCNLRMAVMYTYGNRIIKKVAPLTKADIDIRSLYSSRHEMHGYSQHPCDDIESLGYTMLTIATGKELPWFSLPKQRVINSMEAFLKSDQSTEEVCKAMGISDMGMINVFRNFYQLLRVKYFADGDYRREIDYEDLSDCFVYPARPIQYSGPLNQTTIDKILLMSKNAADTTTNGQYYIARMADSLFTNTAKGVMVKTAIKDNPQVRNEIKVFREIYSKSGKKSLLPFGIANMYGYGLYEGKRAIILNILGNDFMKLLTDNQAQSYKPVCQWAKQMIDALKFLHQHGYVHRGVRPENIAEGARAFRSAIKDSTDVSFKGRAYLFDLGAAERFQHDNGDVKKQTQRFILYNELTPCTSRHGIFGFSLYPRDDMEELGYTMLTIAAGALPWAGFSIGETIRAKAAFFKSGNGVEEVCKAMGMSDIGMINVFKKYFELLRIKYFADDDYSRKINYDELSACFVYPAH